MTFLIKAAIGLAAIFGLLHIGLYFGQRALMYAPDKARVDPGLAGLAGVAERVLETPDGERLIAWQAMAKPGKPTLLYLHGNGGNLSSRAGRIAKYTDKGWGLFMLSYRGYGGSSGSPSEWANLADAELCLKTLRMEGIGPRELILFGESLGSGIATQLAARHDVAGLILDAPFTSMVEMAARNYPWLWVRPFVRDRYDSAAVIASIKAPILILHGDMDRLVPISMGRELAALAGKRAKLVTFPGGDHLNLDDFGALATVADFVAGLKQTAR